MDEYVFMLVIEFPNQALAVSRSSRNCRGVPCSRTHVDVRSRAPR